MQVAPFGGDVNRMIRVGWGNDNTTGVRACLPEEGGHLCVTSVASHVDKRVAVEVHPIGLRAVLEQPPNVVDPAGADGAGKFLIETHCTELATATPKSGSIFCAPRMKMRSGVLQKKHMPWPPAATACPERTSISRTVS